MTLTELLSYPQLLIVLVYCYYLVIGSKLSFTWLTAALLAGAGMLGGALAYRMTFPAGSNVAQEYFQIANILMFGSLLAFEIRATKRTAAVRQARNRLFGRK